MGHLTALGENVEQALQRGQRAKDRLQRSE
jgi:hypothetical protein